MAVIWGLCAMLGSFWLLEFLLQTSSEEAELSWKHSHMDTRTHVCEQAGSGEERGKMKEKEGLREGPRAKTEKNDTRSGIPEGKTKS